MRQSAPPSWPQVDPVIQERADRLETLVGRKLLKIEVVPLGIMFHFEGKYHRPDNGVIYWAYGGPTSGEKT